MPITATCSNCAKSYQAPDSMAGKTVRCKACGTIFLIDAPTMDHPEPGDLDFDALERSFAGEVVDSAKGKPLVDSKGKVSIRRAADVTDVGLASDSSAAMRSNFRYRFPFAKQIDQFLPWVLLLVSFGLLLRWCMVSEAPGVPEAEETPSSGVALSRYFLLLGAYLTLIFPAAHIAMHKASRNLKFSMPRAAAWRSFTGFTPLLLLGSGLYMLSGGSAGGLIFGVLLGTIVSVGAITLLYRLFPNEMPIVGAYTAAGAFIGGTFAIAALFAINLVALSVANMSKKEPELFVSPIALGMRWQDRPAPKVAIAHRPPQPTPVEPEPTPTTKETAPIVAPLPTIEIPIDATDNTPRMVRRVEMPPVGAAFDLIAVPPVASNTLAVIRDEAGGGIACFNTSTWLRTSAGQGFERAQSDIAPNTTGDVAMRITQIPNYRLEAIQLGRLRAPDSILFSSSEVRSLLGFVNERVLLVLVHSGAHLSLERFDVSRGIRMGEAVPFGNTTEEQMNVGTPSSCVRVTPDGRNILIVGRAPGDEGQPGRLALYNTADVSKPLTTRDLPLNSRFEFRPIGLAINNAGKVAMLLNTNNEAYFTLWQMRDETIEGVTHLAPNRPLIDRKLGVISERKPTYWEDWYYDALVWINDNTLLLYGRYIIDARSGEILGATGINDIVGAIRESDNVVAIIQRPSNQFRQLLRVSFDPAAIERARSQQ